VQNIRTALEGGKGVGQVEVSVTSGRARVEYLPSDASAESIAGRITEAGYPAELIRNLSAADYRLLREDAASLADRFVGRIGERLVSRSEYAELLSRYEERGTVPQKGLLRAAWEEILQREILLGAAEKNGVVVQEGEVDLEWGKMRRDNAELDAMVQARGADDYRRRLKEDMIIQRNLEDFVLKGESDESRRRLKLESWYRGFAASIPVVIFDPALKAAVEGGGKGCGGKCCG
jgi:copper chaperone CopZ